MRRYLAVLITILTLGSMILAQDFQVRTRVDLVVVPTSVRDSKGKLVTGLKEKDFTILEDGRPQTISNFSDDPQQLSAAIVIDTGMGGNSMRRLVPLFVAVTNGFSQFDEMASFRYDHLVFKLSDFTNDQDKILKSFDIVKTIAAKQPATVPPGDPAPTVPAPLRMLLGALALGGYGAAIEGANRPPTERLPTVGTKRVQQSRALFDGLYEAAKALETRPAGRRRIIFIISEGQVTAAANTHTFSEITNLLLRDGIELYSVNTDTDPIDRRLGILSSLAKATGGEEFRGLNTVSMENAFSQITEQARYQYTLGYHSTNEVTAGLPTLRTIDVRGRDPSWKVMHRKGYTQVP